MTELAPGWSYARLDTVARVQGGIQKQGKRRPVKNKYPFLRVANVLRGKLDLTEVHDVELFDGELDRYRLEAGDLLVVEGNGSPDQIGRAAVWDGSIVDCVHQNHLIRVRPFSEQLLPKFLAYSWNSPRTSRHLRTVAGSTSGLYTLSTAKVKAVEIPVCSIGEQQRIVDLLEDYLSRLDVGEAYVKLGTKRSATLAASALLDDRSVSASPRLPLKDLLAAPMANGRSVPTEERGFPVLRLTSLRDDRVDLTERKQGAWTLDDARPFLVRRGDFMVARGNGSIRLVARGALVRDDPDPVAYPDTMIRIRIDQAKMLPDYLALIWNSPYVRRQVESMARTTAGIYKVNQKHLASIDLPTPDLAVQREVCTRMALVRSTQERLATSLAVSARRSEALRRALLAAAYSGRLTGGASDMDMVEEMAGV